MRNTDAFSACHPAVELLYFALVLGFSMFLMHPVSLLISLAGAVGYNLRLGGRGAARFQLGILLPMMVMAAVINPAFNHAGVTVLLRLPTGKALTLESVLYGLAAAVMLCAVVCWFGCFTRVFTSDKLVYLFGRVIPALSLVLSMTLRFVPRFMGQLRAVSRARSCLGRDVSRGTARERVAGAVTVLSAVVTWALENAVETADSMKSRGYGLPGRTAFSIYRFDGRDRALLAWILFCGAFLAGGLASGGLYWQYYPSMKVAPVSAMTVGLQLVYLALCMTPLILERREERIWRRLSSEG